MKRLSKLKVRLQLPGLLSFLADNSVKTKVQGLNDFPKSLHPPMIVHYFFDLMVTMGILCFVISGVYVLTLMFKKLKSFLLINGCFTEYY
ncbi:cytochrome ubiquinol oxidase subunit I [Staphylococcus aureus]